MLLWLNFSTTSFPKVHPSPLEFSANPIISNLQFYNLRDRTRADRTWRPWPGLPVCGRSTGCRALSLAKETDPRACKGTCCRLLRPNPSTRRLIRSFSKDSDYCISVNTRRKNRMSNLFNHKYLNYLSLY